MGEGTPQLVVVGAAARDIDESDPRGWRLGGGVSYGALLAGRMGARVGALIGLDPAARQADELELLARAGVEVRTVALSRGPIFENRETPAGRRQTCAGLSDPIEPSALPSDWRGAPAFLLAPVADELDDRWAASVPSEAFVGLAWQGLLRRLEPGAVVVPRPVLPRPLFARADLGGVSREDLRAGGAALGELVPVVGRELAITAGERGALLLRRRHEGFSVRRVPAVPARRIGDLVGAGDSFLTTLLVACLEDGPFGSGRVPVGRALQLAALVATLGIERVGLAGLPDAAQLEERLRDRLDERLASSAPDRDAGRI
jgi:sugar/nucleoside kinase (ribokinase family)